MNEVTVKRAELISRIEVNRTTHRGEFEKAQAGYRVRVIEELDQRLADVRAGRRIDIRILLPEPQDHTSEYDQVLEMLRMSVDETVVIDYAGFRQFVLDEWAWKGQFTHTNTMYVGQS